MKRLVTVCAIALGAAMSSTADAQTMPAAGEEWEFQAILYAYLPSIGGNTAFSGPGGNSSVNVSVDKILDNLNFTFMGTFEARKGRWGIFTDLLYLDVSGSKSNSRDFTIGRHDVPAAATSNLDLGIKGTVWTIAGEYVAVSDPSSAFYVLAGARLLDMKENLDYSLSVDIGPFSGAGRSGSSDVNLSYWDAIVGVKGHVAFGDRHQWFVPYYADVGTGQSDLTWQVFGGFGYTFSWGSAVAGWRYLDYNFKSSSKVESINFNGPMLGVVFAW